MCLGKNTLVLSNFREVVITGEPLSHGLFRQLEKLGLSWNPEPVQNGTYFLSILESKGTLGWRTENGSQSLNSVPRSTNEDLQSACYGFSHFFFLMFLKSSLLYKKTIDTLEMGGWLLGTAFSGDHQQARARKEWVSQQRSSRQNPWSQGPGFKRKLSKNVPKEKRNGKPGTCLCNHELDSRLLTLHLQLSSTFSSACSYVISSRSEEIYSVIPNASSSLLFFRDSANIPVRSCKAPTAGSPGTPGSRFPCK